MFKPLDSMANLLGLCRFYHTDTEALKSIPALKSPASVHRVKCLLEKAKDLGQPLHHSHLEGGNVTLLGLLQELHLRFTLSRIPIFTSDKAKLGQKMQVSCDPTCAYIVKNDSMFLNHIVISHYWSNFVCENASKSL